MLRLAHRILSQGATVSNGRTARAGFQLVCKRLPATTAVIADNVNQYVLANSKPLPYMDGRRGVDNSFIPYGLPPFRMLWVEWGGAEDQDYEQGGCFFDTSLPDESQNLASNKMAYLFTDGCRVVTTMFFESRNGRAYYDGNFTQYICDKCGRIACDESGGQVFLFIRGDSFIDAPPFCIGLMAISFMHCKNVIRHDVTENEGPPQKWLRRTKSPEVRYHVLQIDPMKDVLRREGGIEHNGLEKALHICRGHFAFYTDDKPLFGRGGACAVFRPDHVRGNRKHGIVLKDYAISDQEVTASPPSPETLPAPTRC